MTRRRRGALLAAGLALALGMPAAGQPRPREGREVGTHKGGAAGVMRFPSRNHCR